MRLGIVLRSIALFGLLLPAGCRPPALRAPARSATPIPGGQQGRSGETSSGKRLRVPTAATLSRLIAEEDTDGDKRITIEDRRAGQPTAAGGTRGDKRFWLVAVDGARYEVRGTYYLSNLLQQLKLAQDRGETEAELRAGRIFENPVARVSRSIREIFWDALTRRMGPEQLGRLLADDKTSSGDHRYLYVPASDPAGYAYYVKIAAAQPELRLRVVKLPAVLTGAYLRRLSLEGKHGLLSLALRRGEDGKVEGVPYVVPGGRYNEMYGWDSYFETVGLLVDGRVDLGRAMVDNFVYQLRHYGQILNANRTYMLNRSQPPFLSSMALAVYARLPRGAESRAWLAGALAAAVHEYRTVWTNFDRLTKTGLSRYYGSRLDMGPPPETEPGHFHPTYAPIARARGISVEQLEREYRRGGLRIPELDLFFVHDRCVRESGHDTTYRWTVDGDRCADFVTVDLNALLYKTEIDLARAIERELGGELELMDGSRALAAEWYAKAKRRKRLMLRYLWDESRGLFFDYDLRRGKRHPYVSATTLYPLWAAHPDDPDTFILTKQQAGRMAATALAALEVAGGLVASTEQSRGPISDRRPLRQWDYPHGWPPHQMLAWRGLINYGLTGEAQRLVYRWLYAITRNAADYNGTVPEKLDAVERSHRVFSEYGNVGTKFAYITKEGFGWMNASYQLGLSLLSPPLRAQLDRLVPPEWLEWGGSAGTTGRDQGQPGVGGSLP